VWDAVRLAILCRHRKVHVGKLLRHRQLDFILSEGAAKETHTAVDDAFGPLCVVVTLEHHHLLVTSIIVVELLGVAREHECILKPMQEKCRDFALGTIVQRNEIFNVKVSQHLYSTSDHCQNSIHQPCWYWNEQAIALSNLLDEFSQA